MNREVSLVLLSGVLALQGCTSTVSDEANPEALDVDQSEQAASSQCTSNTGVNPNLAALAVAMANELKRWTPLTDLQQITSPYYGVKLSGPGETRCTAMGGCPNTKALLDMQANGTNDYPNGIRNDVFSMQNWRSELYAAWGRHYYGIQDLQRNNRGALPEDHELTPTSPFSPLPAQTCGPHFFYEAKKPASAGGGPLSKPANLINALLFFGGTNNPFLQFISSNAKVAIDPDEFGNTTPTYTGSCRTYPYDRAYDPNQSLKGTCCTTVSTYRRGTMQPLSYNKTVAYCRPL